MRPMNNIDSKTLVTAALLLAASIPLRAATLFLSDFDTGPQWTTQSGYFTSALGAVTATATLDKMSPDGTGWPAGGRTL